ncbi:MAG TPA: hypothetical protein PKE40_01310 [Arachnia sp.]|nr:hypothetical protein [Arachnia sp.]HMT84966.1 hypothetical protein [Arachnia sp.]
MRWEGDDLVATLVSYPPQVGGSCQSAQKREEFRATPDGGMTLTETAAADWYRVGSVGASCQADVERAVKDGAYRIRGAALAVDRLFLPGEESCVTPAETAAPSVPAVLDDSVFEGEDWVLTTSGFGPLALNQPAPAALQPGFTAGNTCQGPTLAIPGEGTVEIWTDNGGADEAIRAIVLVDDQTGTRSGVGIGTSLSELKETYPDVERPSKAGLEGDADVEFYAIPDGSGAVNVLFEVSDDEVVGVSLQPADSYSSTSDRSC